MNQFDNQVGKVLIATPEEAILPVFEFAMGEAFGTVLCLAFGCTLQRVFVNGLEPRIRPDSKLNQSDFLLKSVIDLGYTPYSTCNRMGGADCGVENGLKKCSGVGRGQGEICQFIQQRIERLTHEHLICHFAILNSNNLVFLVSLINDNQAGIGWFFAM